ncbi:Hypothetical predicted protein, partial [Paramuricea clavata]
GGVRMLRIERKVLFYKDPLPIFDEATTRIIEDFAQEDYSEIVRDAYHHPELVQSICTK